jgi:hypothetical protein
MNPLIRFRSNPNIYNMYDKFDIVGKKLPRRIPGLKKT